MDEWTAIVATLLGAVVAGAITFAMERQRAKEARQRELRSLQLEDIRSLQDTVAQIVLDIDEDYSAVLKRVTDPNESIAMQRHAAVETYTRAEVLVARISDRRIQTAWRDVNIQYSFARMSLEFATSIGGSGLGARGVWVIDDEAQGETKSAGEYLEDASHQMKELRAAYRKFNDSVKGYLEDLTHSSQ